MPSGLLKGWPPSQERSRNSPELRSNLANGWSRRLPQFDRISFRVVQTRKPAVGIRPRINLDRNSCCLELGCHFVEIPDSKLHYPVLVRVPEVAARFRERTENGGACLLTPNGFLVARRGERDPQVLLVPVPQRCGIVSPEEQSSDSRHFFRCRSAWEAMPYSCPRRSRRGRWLCGCLCRYAELVPA